MRLLVVGAGSIGKRHLQNFRQLGVDHVGVVDVRADRRQEVAERFGITRLYPDIDRALQDDYDAVVVGVPTAYHTEVTVKSVRAGAHVLMEKPISNCWDGLSEVLSEVRRKNLVCLVGYTYRFWPPLLKVNELLERQLIGKVYFADITFSEYLPDWHPWEDYRSWFMSKKEQGGGALLDESHAVDMARWLFGEIEEVFCLTGNISHLEMTADDYAQFIVNYASGASGTIHMDLFGRKHRRSIDTYGEKGNICWEFFSNRVDVYHVEEGFTETITFTCERNDMFIAEAKHFLDCIAGRAQPRVGMEEAMRTLKVLLAGVESSETKKMVRVN